MNNLPGVKVRASQCEALKFTPGTLSILKLHELSKLQFSIIIFPEVTFFTHKEESASGFSDLGEITSYLLGEQGITTQTPLIFPFFCPGLKPYETTHSSSTEITCG